MIHELSGHYKIKELCHALGVSRSGYYGQRSGGRSARQEANERLLKEVRVIDREHKQRYGSPRMTRELRRRGRPCGENRVARLMRQQGIRARRKRAFRPRTTQAGRLAAPNLLPRIGAPVRQDQVWVSDITYIATKEGWLYLAAVLDLYSRVMLGWKLGDSMEATLVQGALQRALHTRQPAHGSLCFHSDRGVQYSSETVRKLLDVIAARQSMSAKGNCYDNANMEAFWSSLKAECLPETMVFETKAQARSQLFEYLEGYYNNRRLHSALGYVTPQEYERKPREELARRPGCRHASHAALEDRAMRGRNPSAKAASQTVGSADPGISLPNRPVPPFRAINAMNPRGLGTESPSSQRRNNQQTQHPLNKT